MILQRLERVKEYVSSMRKHSEMFEARLELLIGMASRKPEYDIEDGERHVINMTLQEIDRFYGRRI